MLRILHSVSYMHRAGVETLLMNYYRAIDRTRVQFDFLCHKHLPGDYDDEIRALGGRILYAPQIKLQQPEEYMEFMRRFVEQHPEYRILHAHNGAKQAVVIHAAAEAGIPERIAHAHSTDFIRDDRYAWRMDALSAIRAHATRYFACGNDAGKFFFGNERWHNQGVVMPNAIDNSSFAFDQKRRYDMRSRLGLQECLVVGHVGRFQPQKNQARLLEIFGSLLKRERSARLILIGDGPQKESIAQQIRNMELSGYVLLPGSQSNMPDWYCCMDVFVMPSLFEGLPVTGVEAQACGLPCVFSADVTRECRLTDGVAFISLESSNAKWSEEILRLSQNFNKREQHHIPVYYDISYAATELTNNYLDMIT